MIRGVFQMGIGGRAMCGVRGLMLYSVVHPDTQIRNIKGEKNKFFVGFSCLF